MATNSKDVTQALQEQIVSYATGEDASAFTGYGLPTDASGNPTLGQSTPTANSRPDLEASMSASYERIRAERPEPLEPAQTSSPGGLMNALNRGWERLTVLPDVVQGDVGEIAQYAKDIKKYGRSESEIARLAEIGKSESFGSALLGWLSNPDLTLQVVLESLPMSLPSLGLGAVGMATAGPVGAGAGAFAGSFTVEYLNTILDEVESAGNDPTNPQTLLEAFSNEDFMDAASARGAKRGIPIAIFDALSFGFAGKLVGAAKNAGKLTKTAVGAEVLGLQPGAGALGETFAQIAEGKEKLDFADIAAEYIGDLVPGIAEVAIGRMARSSAAVDPDDTTGGTADEDNGPPLPVGVPVDTPEATSTIDPSLEQALDEQLPAEETQAIPTPTAPAPVEAPQQLGLPLEGGTPVAQAIPTAPAEAPQSTQAATPATPGTVPAPQAPGVAAATAAPEVVAPTPVVEPITPIVDVDAGTLVDPLTTMLVPEDPAIRTAARDVMRALSAQETTGEVEERQRLGRRGAVFTKEGVTDFGKATELLSQYIPQLETLAPGLVEAIQQMDSTLVGQKLDEATQKLTGEESTTTPASKPAEQDTVYDALRFALAQVKEAEGRGTKISDQIAEITDLANVIAGRDENTASVLTELKKAGKIKEARALALAAAKAMPLGDNKKQISFTDLASWLSRVYNKQGSKGQTINKKKLMGIKAGLRAAAELALKNEPTRKPKPKAKTKESTAPEVREATKETEGKLAKTNTKEATKADSVKETSRKRTAEKKAGKKAKGKAKTKTGADSESTEVKETKPKLTQLTAAAMDVVRQVNEHGSHRGLMKMYSGDQLQQMAGKLGLLREGKKGDLAIRIFNFVKLGTAGGKVVAPKSLAAAENKVRAERKAKQEERAKKKATQLNPQTSDKFFANHKELDYVYHEVRDSKDITSIAKNGLNTGTNISFSRDGQAFTMLGDGGYILVFKKSDVELNKKEYQEDAVVTNNPKPIAVIFNPVEKEVTRSEEQLGDDYAVWENKVSELARKVGTTKDALTSVINRGPKNWKDTPLYQDQFVNEPARISKLRSLEREQNKIFKESEKFEVGPLTKPKAKPEPKGAAKAKAKAKATSKQAGGRKPVLGTRTPKAVTPTGNPLLSLATKFFGYELSSKDQLKWSEFKETIGDATAESVRWLTGYIQAFKDIDKSTADITIMQEGWGDIWNPFQDVVNATDERTTADALVELNDVLFSEEGVDETAGTALINAAMHMQQARQTRLAEQALDKAEPADVIAELESQAGTDPLAQTELAILLEQQEQARVADEMGELAPEDFITEQEAADIAEQTSTVFDEEETYSELGDEFALDDSINEQGEYTGKGELSFSGAVDTSQYEISVEASTFVHNIIRQAIRNAANGDGVFRKTTLSSMLKVLSKKLGKDSPYHELIINLQQTMVDSPVEFISRREMFARSGRNYSGLYGVWVHDDTRVVDTSVTQILIVADANTRTDNFIHTFLHEAVHAVTSIRLKTDAVFKQRMETLFEEVQLGFADNIFNGKLEVGGKIYGMTNAEEFIAEAFTNKKFQQILLGIKVPKRKEYGFTSNAFAAFKNIIKKTLGYADSKEYTAFDAVMDAVSFDHAIMLMARNGKKVLTTANGVMTHSAMEETGTKPVGRKAQQRQFDKQLGTAIKKGKGRWKQNRNKFLNLQTVDQIIRRHASKFDVLTNAAEQINPLKQWYKSNLDRIKTARQIHHAARDHVRRFNEFTDESKKSFQQLMLDTTLWNIHPDKGIHDVAHDHLKDKKLKVHPDVLKKHIKLQAKWKTMGAAEKKLYLDMVEAGAKLRKQTIAALMERIGRRHGIDEHPEIFNKFKAMQSTEELNDLILDSVLDVPALADVKKSANIILNSLNVKGPYLPVRRYGKFISSAKRDESLQFATEADAQAAADAWAIAERANKATVAGDIVTFTGSVYSEHQTLNEAEEAKDEYIRLGYAAGTANANAKDVNTLATAAGLTTLMRQLDKTVKTDALKGQLDNAIAELLAENVNQASKLRRANIPGARPEDMMRGYAERMYGAGWNLGDILTSYSMDNAMHNMRGLTRAGNDIETIQAGTDTLLRRKDLYNHILKLEDNTLRDRNSSGINRFLGGTGFLWYLASPSYAFVNATQVPLITLPYLSSKYGYGKSSAELTKLYKDVLPQLVAGLWSSKVGVSGTEEAVYDRIKAVMDKQGFGEAFQQLTDLNVIDATFIQELVDTVNGMTTSGKTSKGLDSVLRVARTLPLSIETVNRVVTGMAAYKLAKGNQQQKVEAAAEAIRETQFDYSIFNRPHWFKALPASRALMMFKMYPQGIYSLLTTGIQGLAKQGKRAEAAKLLSGLVATHTLAAGVLGGVMLEPLRLLLSALPDDWTDWDDDEEFDAWARRIATDEMGMSAAQAQVFLKGIPNLAGIDVYSRLGLHNLVMMQAPDLSDRTGFLETMVSLGGPIAQIPFRGFDAYTTLRDGGDVSKAIQQAFPVTAVRQIAKAYRLNDQGMTDYRGNLLVNKNKFNWRKIALTSVGFQPSVVSETYEARNAVLGKQHSIDDRRNGVMQQLRTARTAKERRDARRAQRRFNMSVEFERRIMARDVYQSKKNQREREQETRKGVHTKYQSQRREVDRYNLP